MSRVMSVNASPEVANYVRWLARQGDGNVSKTIESILREHMEAAAAKWKEQKNG